MPKSHPDFPHNLTFRISIAQRDHLDAMASLHEVKPSEYLRGLIDNDRVDGAISTIDSILSEVQ